MNAAGSSSDVSDSIGPYYTRIVTLPRPPVVYKLQALESAIIVAWALDSNPDVAGYLAYRGTSLSDLSDLRFFGPDPSHPSTTGLATIGTNFKQWPLLSFGSGTIDPRIIGFVPDPRLCVRDYTGSDMGEIPLPAGPPPDAVNAVYRVSEYDPTEPPTNQPQAFNYWTPPAAGGIAQVVTDSSTRSRLTGLRIGLGRGVPVVVVATYAGVPKVMGQVPVRRIGFVDGVSTSGVPFDPNALAGAAPPSTTSLNTYAIVSVDIFGNRSASSTVFASQMLAPALVV